MLEVWKKQFTIARFSLYHDDPNVFIISQWQRNPGPNAWYLAYRVLMTSFFVVVTILSIVDERNLDKPYMFRVKWLIYLTNWGFTMATVQSLLCTIMLSTRFHSLSKGRAEEDDNKTQLYKIYWATNIIATDAAFAITVLYWAIIYDAKTMPLDYLNVLVHACNCAAMIVEFCLVAHPVKLGHFYLPMIFGVAYSIFSAIYFFLGGTSRDGHPNIYRVIDWTKPVSTLSICVGATIFLVVIHCCSYVLFRLRARLASLLTQQTYETDKAQIPIDDMFKGLDNDAIGNTII